ncbi:MAG: condensation domain-containing protein [Gammaproteobacteria bacterium]
MEKSCSSCPANCRSPSRRSTRHLAELARQTFDLRDGPLLRVFLSKLATDDHLLLILSHHIVSDAWSSGVLFRDLAASYDARHQGHLPQLPALSVQYADFAVWQRDWLAGAELRRQAAFWRNHLGGAPAVLELPTDRPRPRLQSYRGHRLGHGLPVSLSADLQKIANQEGATLFMLLFAAFNVLLSRWSGQQDLVVGTPIAGRRRTELEGLVGFFANTLALRTRLTDVQGFRELLHQVRSTALHAFEHQDLPFEKLVEVLNPARSLAHSPVFQVLFVLQNAPWEAGQFGDLEVSPAELEPSATARFDLTLSVSDYAGQLWLGLEYSTDLFDSDTIARLAAGFETLLTAIAADPGTAITDLPTESPADRQLQLQDWQPSPTPLPADTDIYTLFANQVSRTPHAIAVECNGGRLSYAALETRVEEIVSLLKAAGSTDTAPVALCLPRSVDMLAAVLAVLRAGGWYLPLDPALPPARLQFMLRDSGARVLLTANSQQGDFAGFPGIVVDLGTADGDSESR